MRFGRDPDQVVQVTWSFCQPGALPLGLPTCFVSRDHEAHEIWPEIGEVQFAPRKNLDPNLTSLEPGTNPPCGDPEVWLNGYPGHVPPNYPLDAYGSSMCCADPIEVNVGLLGYWPSPEPDGGLAVGGIAGTIGVIDRKGGFAAGGEPDLVRELEPAGGLASGGRADPIQPLQPAAGLALGGEAGLAGVIDTDGGPAWGGAIDHFGVLRSEGGGALGGEADSPGVMAFAGGSAFGGGTDKVGILEARGGPAFGGKAEVIRSLEAAGGIALGGVKDQLRTFEAAGGLAWGGSAERVYLIEPKRGLALGGASNPPFPMGVQPTYGGVGVGGNPDTPSWIGPTIVNGNNVVALRPATLAISSGSFNPVSGLCVVWLIWQSNTGNGSGQPSITTAGWTQGYVSDNSPYQQISIWWASTSVNSATIALSWAGVANSTNTQTGFMYFNNCPSPTIDATGSAGQNTNAPSIVVPKVSSLKSVICVVGCNFSFNYYTSGWTNCSGNYGETESFACAMGSYAIGQGNFTASSTVGATTGCRTVYVAFRI
jgi:hypothetical protein